MDVTAELDAACPPEALFAWVEDLGRYPAWLDIVPRAEPDDGHGDADGGPAWRVDLRGRLGPLARSKRLRMVRTRPRVAERGRVRAAGARRAVARGVGAAGRGRCARRYGDGEPRSRLTMHLHYGGGLWGPVLERVLGDEIERSRPRLVRRITGDRAGG